MMMCRVTASLLCVWLVAASSAAWAQVLPYESFPLSEYPSSETLTLQLTAGPYPDLDPQALEFASYSQLTARFGEVCAVLLRANVPAYVTVLHYAPDGITYVPQPGIKLPPNHQLSVSFELPGGTRMGVTRVILWQVEPDLSWTRLLASHPNFLDEDVPGLLTQRWFERGESAFDRAPWEDPFRETGISASGFSSRWPFAQAELGVGDLVEAKDSVVSFTGSTTTAADMYGVFGRWSFYWGSELIFSFYLPPNEQYSRAELHLIGDSPVTFGFGGASFLNLKVNGWSLHETVQGIPQEDGSELFAYPLSQYLEDGSNEIVISLDSFSGSEWMLDRIELWIE